MNQNVNRLKPEMIRRFNRIPPFRLMRLLFPLLWDGLTVSRSYKGELKKIPTSFRAVSFGAGRFVGGIWDGAPVPTTGPFGFPGGPAAVYSRPPDALGETPTRMRGSLEFKVGGRGGTARLWPIEPAGKYPPGANGIAAESFEDVVVWSNKDRAGCEERFGKRVRGLERIVSFLLLLLTVYQIANPCQLYISIVYLAPRLRKPRRRMFEQYNIFKIQ
jgi:hypothetical protein